MHGYPTELAFICLNDKVDLKLMQLLCFGFWFNALPKIFQDAHKYSGMVEDCCCNYETVDHLNEEVLHPILQELVKTPFFRYFKVGYSWILTRSKKMADEFISSSSFFMYLIQFWRWDTVCLCVCVFGNSISGLKINYYL